MTLTLEAVDQVNSRVANRVIPAPTATAIVDVEERRTFYATRLPQLDSSPVVGRGEPTPALKMPSLFIVRLRENARRVSVLEQRPGVRATTCTLAGVENYLSEVQFRVRNTTPSGPTNDPEPQCHRENAS
jgi:hypothetical protein